MTKNVSFFCLFLIIFLAYFLISLPYYSGDIKNHLVWGESIASQGTFGFFERKFPGYSFPTYPPLIDLLFAGSFILYELVLGFIYLVNRLPVFPSSLVWFFEWENTRIAFLKLSGIVPVLALSFLSYKFINFYKGELVIKNKYLVSLAIILNPAVIYLAALWGQTDVLQNLLILIAFYFLFRKKVWISAVFAALALLSKQTILVVFGVYLLTILKVAGLRNSIISSSIIVLVFYLAYIPFFGLSLTQPLNHYFTSISLVDFGVAENAINLWGAIFTFKDASSNQVFWGLQLDVWGYVMFLGLIGPITLIYWIRKFNYEKFFLYLFLSSAISFFVLTRMHERYLIPAVIFSTFLLNFGKKYLIGFIFLSALFFLNLYRGLFQPDIPFLNSLAKSSQFLTTLVFGYAGVLIYNYYLFIRDES